GAAARATTPSPALSCRSDCQREIQRSSAPAATGRLALLRRVREPGAPQYLLPDAEILGAEVSSCSSSGLIPARQADPRMLHDRSGSVKENGAKSAVLISAPWG